MKSGITWRRTFPECEPGTDGVALFEGRVIGGWASWQSCRATRGRGCGSGATVGKAEPARQRILRAGTS